MKHTPTKPETDAVLDAVFSPLEPTHMPSHPPMTFVTAARVQRINLKHIGDEVRSLMSHPGLSGEACPGENNPGEARANIMLSFRHLEDAAMRLGKAIQAMDGGVSCYDDKAKIAAETLPSSPDALAAASKYCDGPAASEPEQSQALPLASDYQPHHD